MTYFIIYERYGKPVRATLNEVGYQRLLKDSSVSNIQTFASQSLMEMHYKECKGGVCKTRGTLLG